MIDFVLLYISAAQDLAREREVLSRAVTEVPVPMGWRIYLSPVRGEPADLEAVVKADMHLLLLGGDIRAPIGLEWRTARRGGRQPVMFLKQGITRTLAAQEYIRYLEGQAEWRLFKDSTDLRRQALFVLADHFLNRSETYKLSLKEFESLKDWQAQIEFSAEPQVEDTRGGAGESGIILTVERYMPTEGVLIRSPEEKDQ